MKADTSGKKRIPIKDAVKKTRAFLHTQEALRILVCAVGTLLMMLIYFIAVSPVRYNLQIGMVPTATISATKDVVDEITTQKNRVAAAAGVTPTYRYQEGVAETVLADIDTVFAQLRAVRQYGETLPENTTTRRYSTDELAYARAMLTEISLRDYQLTTLLNTSQEALDTLYSTMYAAVKNTMAGNVTQGMETEAINSVLQIIGYRTETDLLQNVAQPVLKATVLPNMVIDQAATELARQDAMDAVEDVVYKQGQNIVVRGEGRVQDYQLAMLRSLGLLNDERIDLNMYLGACILVIAVVAVMLETMRRFRCGVIGNLKKLLLLFIIMVTTLAVSLVAKLETLYLAPVAMTAMLLTGLINMQTGMISGVAMTVLVSSLAAGSSNGYTSVMVYSLVCGVMSCTMAALVLREKSTRLRILLSGLVAAVCNMLLILAYALMTDSQIMTTLSGGIWSAVGAIIASFLCLALQPLFETLFNLPTVTKLLELSNPNQPLMRRLMLEAPGTYHHSMVVANLAEASAEAVGANALLARVGGYYHDIGKLKRPLYFKENQMGDVNAHDKADPQVSAAIVTAHTRDGVALARQYRLPVEIQQMIAEHHGDTPVMFFYHKAMQQAGGKNVDIANFRYDGHPPTSKESAILMLCDTIEAAVRSMKDPTPEAMEEFIVKLVRGKLEDGQLAESPLTLHDIDAICAACITVLNGVFHERIEYPDTHLTEKQLKEHRFKSELEAATEKAILEDGEEEKKEAPNSEEKAEPAEHDSSVQSEPTAVVHPTEKETLPEPKPAVIPEIISEHIVQPPEVQVVLPEQFKGDIKVEIPQADYQASQIVTPPPCAKPVKVDELLQMENETDKDNEKVMQEGREQA